VRHKIEAELKALWSSATWVQDLVLGGSNGTPPLAASVSSATDLIEGHVDAMTKNGVLWGPSWC
jgi:hypothetical protein